MPIYEYACTACGERTEAKQGFDDPPLEECPVCGGRLRKLYSPVGIVFKGSGFYSTDKKAHKKEHKKKDSDGASAADKSKPSKSDKSSADKPPASKSTSKESSGTASQGARDKG